VLEAVLDAHYHDGLAQVRIRVRVRVRVRG
jgi:hypothetical protein